MIHTSVPVLFLAAFLPLQTASAADPLIASPLFGYAVGGDPFDDGVTAVFPQVARLHSLHICYGDVIDGIQLFYLLQDNSTFIASPHGEMNENCGKNSNKTKIFFKEDETLIHIKGLIQKTWQYISQLTLFTSVAGGPPKTRGPFGRGGSDDVPFSLTGDIRGIFGRSGDVLDSIGFYINTSAMPLTFYQKTDLIGGEFGSEFDDFKLLTSKNEKPLKITNMIINYNPFINGIQATYMVSNGSTTTITHGNLEQNFQGSNDFAVLDFDVDEWITRVNISSKETQPYAVHSLEIETTNSKGSVRSYGPFGQVNSGNVTTIKKVVHGLYGHSDYSIYSLGFYI